MMAVLEDDAVNRTLAVAVGHQQAGRLAEAEAIYRRILEADSRHADALHLLGLVASRTGRPELACRLIRAAIGENGRSASYRFNLGLILQELGRPEEAVDCFRQAEALQPLEAPGLNALGQALRAAGRLEEAADSFRQGLAQAPDRAELHNNLALVLLALGRPAEAAAGFRQALAIQPDAVEALGNLGLACRDLGQSAAAEACFRQALALKPDSAIAANNLGLALRDQGRLADAAAWYRQVLTVWPESVAALLNLGNVLMDQGRPEDAAACARRALALKPDHAEAHDNLLFALCFQEDADPEAVFAEHLRFGAVQIGSGPAPAFANQPDPERRLRIGYLSPDFRRSPCGHSLLPVLEHHDHREVELFCYDNTLKADDVSGLFRACADHWRPCRALSDRRLAETIRADGIDILVDCGGHMAGTRLPVLGRRPAPIQLSYPLYPNTTGVAAVDYRIMDPYFAPPWADAWHSEKLVRLPDTHVCYRPSRTDLAPAAEPPCLANGFVTFGSFNNLAKLGPATVAAWAEILRALPDARLMLKWKGLGPGSESWCADRFAAHGIGPERLILAPPTPDPYTPYLRLDVALDPLAVNGGTTTLDALWMGVPVVTRAGRTPFSRVGLGHLTNVGLSELIAADTAGYVAIAVGLARDRERLRAVRRGLRARFAASPLMDARRYTGHLERAYRILWRRWCAGEAPAPLAVSP